MKYEFCLNPASIPAASRHEADKYLDAIFIGIASLCQNTIPKLFSDDKLDTVEVAKNYSYATYRESIVKRDLDLAGFVLSIEDLSPFLDIIADSDLLEIADSSLQICNSVCKEYDILKFAYLKDMVLLSLPTSEFWKSTDIPVIITQGNTLPIEKNLLNIYSDDVSHLLHNENWQEELSECVFSDNFNQWYCELPGKDKLRVENLLKRAYSIKFKGTVEQTKQLKNSKEKICEYRGGCSSYAKGRIRILYKTQSNKFYVLLGFVKHSNDEYDDTIPLAENIFKSLLQ